MRGNLNILRGPFVLFFVLPLVFSTGSALAVDGVWAALKKGGMVIVMRHTHVDIREGIGRHEPGNCEVEVNLSKYGVDQAKRIGEAFRAHDVLVGEVLSSPYCRNMDTGRLVFGRATAAEFLMPPGVVSDRLAILNRERSLQRIVEHSDPANLVIITHDLNILEIVLDSAAPGEFFVLQPDGTDFTVIGNILIE